jgi:hypothetical protein
VEIWARNSFSGVSSGTSIFGDENLEAVDPRKLRLWTDDLCETAADVREDLAVDTRPGILGFVMSALYM